MTTIKLPAQFHQDISDLLQTDSVFKKSGIGMDDFSWREPREIFPALVGSILSQQVSTAAAASMWRKLEDRTKGKITVPILKKFEEEDYRACGFSRQKISYARGLIDAIEGGTFDPDALPDLEDDDVLEAVTALKGFGVWSAQMVLIFTLHRPDIWPAGDLGIRMGVQLYKKMEERPDIEATEKFGKKFKGRRSSAALLLWKMKDK